MVESGAATTTGEATPTSETPQDKGQKKGKLFGGGARKKKAKPVKKTEIPELVEGEFKEIDLVPITEPHCYVRIILNIETNEYIYNVIEPDLSKREENALNFIVETLGRVLDYDEKIMQLKKERQAAIEKIMKEKVKEIFNDYSMELDESSKSRIEYYIIRDFAGYGKIDVIMRDEAVEDVSCDGPEIPLFLYHREYGSIKSNVTYDTDEELEGFVIALAQRCGRVISIADPVLDATLPDGSRLNCTLGREVTTRGSSYTIRKFTTDPLTMIDLIRFNTLSYEMGAHLWLACQYGESIISAGGTASGKTSTMNAVALFIPPACKIISIEDTREINLPHENWIAGVTRGGAEAENPGDIDMYQLLRAALRQRPEYVLVGEVRGKETMTMFQAMATGHITYSTMHADSVKSIVHRLENPPINIPRVLLNALNLVIIHHILRVRDKTDGKLKRVRRITELVEIVGLEPLTLEIITNRVYQWNPSNDDFQYTGHSKLYEKIMDLEDMTADTVLVEVQRRSDILRWMDQNDVRRFHEVASTVAEYYEHPDDVLNRVYKGLGKEPPKVEEEVDFEEDEGYGDEDEDIDIDIEDEG
jgi:flagellar protein FlaI